MLLFTRDFPMLRRQMPRHSQLLMISCAVGASLIAIATPESSMAQEQPPAKVARTPASIALSTMFSPLDAPQRKTMGLLQRSFLEMASDQDRVLEVALVIDATESMASELNGVQSSIQRMLDDLRRFRKEEVRVSIVLYRDQGSPSGEVEILLPEFTSDEAMIQSVVAAVKPESGAPFFHELPDLGLHTALTKLPWSNDPGVSKWILLFGDAPPYSVAYRDAKHPGAHRRFTDEILVSLAARQGVQINCILCTSGEDSLASYQDVLDQTRDFMNSLSSQSSGVMLDLSYPAIQQALLEASNRPQVKFTELEPITSSDLAQVRRVESSANAGSIRLAVMPHEPFQNMQFGPKRPSVQVATAIRHRFSQLPGVRAVSPVDLQRQVRRLRYEGLSENQAIRGLAARLRVDYVLWGEVMPEMSFRTAAYRRNDGAAVVQLTHQGEPDQIPDVLLTKVASKNDQAMEPLSQLARKFASNAGRAILQAPIAETRATAGEILAAMEALEQATGLEGGSEDSAELLEMARESAMAAGRSEPRNSLAIWLASNAEFNLALIDFRRGDEKAGASKLARMRALLNRAASVADSIKSAALRLEVKSDAALLVRKDVRLAITGYEAMTSLKMPLSTQRRGHWMLAGIYAGDWGTPNDLIDSKKSRQHVVEILANWPESNEASLLKKWLQWDDEKEKTEHNHLPRAHSFI